MNTFSEKITNKQAEQIREILKTDGAVFDSVAYSVWRAKTKEYTAIYYESGKILIQGKEISQIVKILGCQSAINNEQKSSENIKINAAHIGTDESGKGDFFGPLVIAGVLANESNSQKFIDLGIKDSKKLDDKVILNLAAKIKANSEHSVIVITPIKYNELYNKFKNLNKLLAWGHARAIENILNKAECEYVLADKFGDESLIQNALMAKGQKIILKQEVRAEADIAVAAASVLARAEFVKRMKEMEYKYEITLSKGASQKVVEQAKEFIKKYSASRLNEVAKMHFKTAKEVLNQKDML